MHTIALRSIAIMVLVPSTLAACFWSIPGTMFVVDALQRHEHLRASVALSITMAAGWFGLITAWRLYYDFLRGRLTVSRPVAWAGLICGSLASLALIMTTGGALAFRIVCFGWPLLAVACFSVALWRRPVQSIHPIKPQPLGEQT
ncbi:hypothetical protein ACYX7E_03300 [Luteimonas sp. RIT-PG2_3]